MDTCPYKELKMAIKINDYKQINIKNIKQHKENKKQFLFDFRIEGKRYRKIYKITQQNQSSKEDIQEAKQKLIAFKEEIKSNKKVSIEGEGGSCTTSARELFRKIYSSINELYATEPLVKAFFFFAFSGRSKDEISSLKWEYINFRTATYWVRESKKHYPIPEMVKEVLFQMYQDNSEGLVFQDYTKERIIDIPIQDLRDYVGVSNLTLESMRTILVDALKEESNSK